VVLLILGLLATLVPAVASAQMTGMGPLMTPDPDDWPMYHRSYSGHPYSPLAQITRDNVKNLQVAWVHQPGRIGQGFLATPIAVKSLDGGATWRAAGLTNISVYTLAIDPQTPTTLYAGTQSRGVFKSLDGGGTWSVTGLSSYDVRAIAIDPQTPTTLYVGINSVGVGKSTDSGSTWSALNSGLTNPYVNALAIDPQAPTTIYVGTQVLVGTVPRCARGPGSMPERHGRPRAAASASPSAPARETRSSTSAILHQLPWQRAPRSSS